MIFSPGDSRDSLGNLVGPSRRKRPLPPTLFTTLSKCSRFQKLPIKFCTPKIPPCIHFPPITGPCLAPRRPSPTGGMAPGPYSPTFHCVNLRPPTRGLEPMSLYHCGHFLGFSLVSVWFYVCNGKMKTLHSSEENVGAHRKKLTKAIHLRTRIHLNA